MLVYNSLSKEKEPLPAEKPSLSWYVCGPTVYDSAHLGHARNYVTTDILRRILIHYGYDVNLVMNITDVDDKIIRRAQEQNVSFGDLAKRYEKEFVDDMRNLNVLSPHTLTRVTEYIPEILVYIQRIIDNGYAYPLEGSVYFDSQKFTEKHAFSPLKPCSHDDADCDDTRGRKSAADFALWKQSPDGVGWPSPWGFGHCGWHIECSAMSHAILGDHIDIHSGGEDLAFPHHNNEIAQADAHRDKPGEKQVDEEVPWVHHFLHVGHLHIEGRKMSKSLKNFVTIRDALQHYTSRQIRMLCLLHHYRAIMTFGEESMKHAAERDQFFSEFLGRSEALLRTGADNKSSLADTAFLQTLLLKKTAIDAALKDDFDTPLVLKLLSDLIHETNVYLRGEWQRGVLEQIREYILHVLGIFGLDYTSKSGEQETEVINALSTFRDNVRLIAKSKTIDRGALLKLTDEVRDKVFPSLGLKLTDVSAGGMWSRI